MAYTDMSFKEYCDILSSSSPTPGGGGASALAGALGVSLGNMVGSLTVGKKKYAGVSEDIKLLMESAVKVKERFIELSERDARAFEPLSKAYGMPKATPEEKQQRQEVMERALHQAAEVPLEIMETCLEAIALLEEFAQKGSAIAISDAGVGAAMCRAALGGAALNVYINTKLMLDRAYAEKLNARTSALLDEGARRAAAVYAGVLGRLVN